MFYTSYHTNDTTMQNICFAYCEGRSFLWNMFFGWRRTYNKEMMEFILPSNKIKILKNLAFDIDKSSYDMLQLNHQEKGR